MLSTSDFHCDINTHIDIHIDVQISVFIYISISMLQSMFRLICFHMFIIFCWKLKLCHLLLAQMYSGFVIYAFIYIFCLMDCLFNVWVWGPWMGSAGVAKRLQSAPHAVDRAFQNNFLTCMKLRVSLILPRSRRTSRRNAFGGARRSSSELVGARRNSPEPSFSTQNFPMGTKGGPKTPHSRSRDLPAPPKDGTKVKSTGLKIIEIPRVL